MLAEGKGVSKWIRFDLAAVQKPKTSVWNVSSKAGYFLGQVRWTAPWRTYAFFPAPETVFEDECLQDIAGFISGAMKARKGTT